MADDAAVQIAEAVKDALNAGTFSMGFTAARAYDLTAELKDDGILHVDVGIRAVDGEVSTRSEADVDVAIDIVVRKKCDVGNVAVLDALSDLVREFRDEFFMQRIDTATLGEAWCSEYERTPYYLQNHIRLHRQFTAPLTLKFNAAEGL